MQDLQTELQSVNEQLAALNKRKQQLESQLKPLALAKVRELVAIYGLTQAQVGLSSMSRVQAKPSRKMGVTTFYDPNRGLAWDGTLSGKGRKPDWINKAIADGTIEHFRVKIQSSTPVATAPASNA